jgi:hypothetical protein
MIPDTQAKVLSLTTADIRALGLCDVHMMKVPLHPTIIGRHHLVVHPIHLLVVHHIHHLVVHHIHSLDSRRLATLETPAILPTSIRLHLYGILEILEAIPRETRACCHPLTIHVMIETPVIHATDV